MIEVSGFVDRTVVRHEKDEEESLFPRLRDDAELAPLIEQLEREHREHEKLHERLRAIAGACDGALSDEDRARLGALVDELDAAYEKHVDVEEGELFPAAKAALDAATQRAIAEEMQARRGRGGKRR